jgi:beta-glucosidase
VDLFRRLRPAVLGATPDGSVANAGTTATQVTVRLDNPTHGPVLGTLTVPPTGDKYTYPTVTGTLAATHERGQHAVYLVFDGPADLYTVRLRS